MPTYQGPQRPGYSFTPGGGSAQTNVPATTIHVPGGGSISVEEYNRNRSRGGGGVRQQIAEKVARENAAAALEKAKLEAENIAKIEAQKQAAAEKIRIENLRRAIVEKGAQERQRILLNERGERVKQTTTEIKKIENGKSTNALVWKYENLDTGEVRYRSYEGAGRRDIGGVDFAQQSASEANKIKIELVNAGLDPIYNGSQVVGFSSKETGQSYIYNDAGINAFNKRIEMINSEKSKTQKQGVISRIATGGDKFINNVGETVKKQLARVGIRAPSIPEKYTSAVKDYLRKAGLDKASFQEYQNKLLRLKSNLGIQLQNIKPENQRVYNELVARVKSANPNLTDYQLKQKVSQQMTGRSLLDALTTVSIYGNIIIAHTANYLIGIGLGTPELLKQIKNAPLATLVALPPAIVEGVKQDWKRVYGGGAVGFGEVVAEYYTMGKIFKITKAAVKGGANSVAKILPGTRVLRNGRIVIRRATKTTPGLALKSQTLASGAASLSKQTRYAGKTVTAVTAQAERLTSLLRRKKIIRKPIPGEANFPSQIKRILAKFDAGKRLTNKEFTNVNMWLRRNVAPHITLLERSLYLDPASGLRISRLGIQPPAKTATLRDILRGNFTLWQRQGKPQILVFENAKIAKFPKSLRMIERKLKTGQKLTGSELNKLIRWQVQTGSGRFKPIGSTIYAGGRELEITLAPGELIRRIKSLGRVYIDGRKVSIVSAEVFKPPRAILKQMRLAELGRLSKSALNSLNNFLSKKLGRRVRVETPEINIFMKTGKGIRRLIQVDPNTPVLRVRGLGVVVLRGGMRGLVARPSLRTPVKFRGRLTARTVKGGRVITRTIRPARKGSRRAPSRRIVNGRVTPSTPGRVNGRAVRKNLRLPLIVRAGRIIARRKILQPRKPIPTLKANKGFKPQNLSKPVQTYYVVEKIRGKFRKLYPKPLSLRDARDYAVYSIDNKLSRTAFFVPLGMAKRVVRPPKPIQNYAARNAFKVRPYRIRFGKRRKLVNGYIEKRRFFQDTAGERTSLKSLRRITPQRRKQLVRQLQKARTARFGNRVHQIRPMIRRPLRRTRRISMQQRRILIARLKKARMVRMRMLRRRR